LPKLRQRSEFRDPDNECGKILKNRLVDLDKYKDRWHLIQDFLELPNKNEKGKPC